MKNYYASESVRKADLLAAEKYATPGIVLMENAGRSAAEAILRRYPDARDILILCGPGNNGGDGFTAARHLLINGRAPRLITVISPSAYKNDAAGALKSTAGCGVPMTESASLADGEAAEMLRSCDLIVDALLGTGSAGEPRGEVARLLSLIKNNETPELVALDIPSGVNPDTGEASEDASSAALTLTFLAEKPGLAVTPGALRAGVTEVCGIGAPTELILTDAPVLRGYDRGDLASLLPSFDRDAHKGKKGSLLVLGGCRRYHGAPMLAAMGAIYAGCGVVTLALSDFAASAASALLPEAIFEPLPTENGSIRADAVADRVDQWMSMCDAAVLGPGIGRDANASEITKYFWRHWQKPLLVDADALFHLANCAAERGFVGRENAVITPHAGEAAKLLGKDAAGVAASRLASCRELAARYSVALLKGANTLITDGSDTRVILEGAPALAAAGSGDVLSGAIGAFLSVRMKPLDAATAAAILHGKAGTDAEREGRVLSARDIARALARRI